MTGNADQFTIHIDADLFRSALTFTEAKTGFSARLIEKDYYCSLILNDLAPMFQQGLVFRGGTCLNKVHAGFYRLSEDLDFMISISVDATRAERRDAVAHLREHIQNFPTRIPGFRVTQELKGHNESRQYIGTLAYPSVLSNSDGTIKLEVGLREPVLIPPKNKLAKSVLLDPFKESALFADVDVAVLTPTEAYAEKVRAALTRREPAIRDVYDLRYAVNEGILDFADPNFIMLVRNKLSVASDDPVDVSEQKLAELKRQVDKELKPVLRPSDFKLFNLDSSWELLTEIAKTINK